ISDLAAGDGMVPAQTPGRAISHGFFDQHRASWVRHSKYILCICSQGTTDEKGGPERPPRSASVHGRSLSGTVCPASSYQRIAPGWSGMGVEERANSGVVSFAAGCTAISSSTCSNMALVI